MCVCDDYFGEYVVVFCDYVWCCIVVFWVVDECGCMFVGCCVYGSVLLLLFGICMLVLLVVLCVYVVVVVCVVNRLKLFGLLLIVWIDSLFILSFEFLSCCCSVVLLCVRWLVFVWFVCSCVMSCVLFSISLVLIVLSDGSVSVRCVCYVMLLFVLLFLLLCGVWWLGLLGLIV